MKRIQFILTFTLLSLFLLLHGCKQNKGGEEQYTGPLFAENIRTTGPLLPEEELQNLKVPEGFEIQLFASEPDIDKPMNMAFDAQGRMWVTQSFEYPFPKSPDVHGTDRLTILEDTNGDGRADKFTHVSDTLNIPIGVLPYHQGALTFSVPNLYQYSDGDQNDKPEAMKVLFGPFGFQDTHGMVSNFFRGYDGWVYACHGFTNFSSIAGTDGDSIKMSSGNTFRFRLDGSRVEQTTFGQVNPFGLAMDEYGYVYSTDSHSSPLYQLIRGGDYPHFNKLEIMAFGPDMKSFDNEATALCGIAYYQDNQFPADFQRNFFIGDAFNSRVHRYSWVWKGSSPAGKSEEDFVKSADPWFRPVNVKMGPDGALYVADFYNAIIGHYEVPLGHPKRDKKRGRIWRITYKGSFNKVANLASMTADELLPLLDADNQTTRMLAADQLADRVGSSAVSGLQSVLSNANTSPRQYMQALWVIFRLNSMDAATIQKALAHADPLVRVHALRVLREWKHDGTIFYPLIKAATKDPDAHVQRIATELLMSYPVMESVVTVLDVMRQTGQADTHLKYTTRLVLRNLMRHEDLMKQTRAKTWSESDEAAIAGTLIDVPSAEAALFLSSYLKTKSLAKEKTQLGYQQAIRFLPASQVDAFILQAKSTTLPDVDQETMKFRGLQEGLASRGGKGSPAIFESWGKEIAENLLKKYPAGYRPVSEEIFNQQKFALQLAGDYKARGKEESVRAFIDGSNKVHPELVATAFRAIFKMGSEQVYPLAGQYLGADSTGQELRKLVVAVLGEFPTAASLKVLAGITKAPPALETLVATALAGSAEGRKIIFDHVRSGQYMVRTLVDPRVEERIHINISKQQQKEYDELTANISPISEARQKLIDERLREFKKFKPTTIQLDSGQIVYGNNCGVCHRKTVQSGIGPQLHGIGKRGADAIAEKILDPNRNISEAFRNYTIKLKDGKVVTGLFRREQGAVVVFGDLTGKEFSIPKKDIVEQRASQYTIMPDHFGTTLSQHEFDLLLTYLLNW